MEMSEEDRPPEDIWLDPEAIAAHFDVLAERYANPNTTGSGSETVPQAPTEMQENELTRGLRR